MRFTPLFTIAAPALLIAGAAIAHAPIPADTLETLIKNLNQPDALDAFKAVLNGEVPPFLDTREFEELARRQECCEYGICCNIETCQEDGSSCLQMCFGYQSPWQQLGCIAGCATTCG
ncbi:uncharacterized protein DSM5745_09591 [Aspergillus mulundensis]|uniref:Uncharacterized protein n=1 Tax=Aspergillus mulundensis TaxID=1810919 RepID=A0A3D8QVR0_9EURO|nr:Uncharacterized protein DSM5745_09591 [Aspergillus mulundensis]RDW65852.1 Uncharacterized protein DSM5745_09591 [Aspergillus mulundensis]